MAGALQNCPCCLPPIHPSTGWKLQFTNFWQMIKSANAGVGATGYPQLIYRHGGTNTGTLVVMDTVRIDDTNNYVYTAVGGQIRKWSVTNFVTPTWTISIGTMTNGANWHGLCVDLLTGNVIHIPVVSGTTRLYETDASGALIFNTSVGAIGMNSVCTDGVFIYITGAGMTIYKYTVAGVIVWTQVHTIVGTSPQHRGVACNATCVAVVTDRGAGFGAGGISGVTQTVCVRDSTTRAIIWTADHGIRLWDCAYLSTGDLVVVGERASSACVRCYDSTGATKWTFDHRDSGSSVTAILYSLTVDSSDNIYVVGDVSGPKCITTRKIDKNGNLIWSNEFACGTHAGSGSGGNLATGLARGVAINAAKDKVYSCGLNYNFWRTQ